jgi:hypothetical protein
VPNRLQESRAAARRKPLMQLRKFLGTRLANNSKQKSGAASRRPGAQSIKEQADELGSH